MNERNLAELHPNKKLYLCNSIDHIMNIRETVGLSKKLNGNPGKTGNLLCELKLKIGYPVVVTTNHPKSKYREDGIMNGARGFVQNVRVSKDNPEKR